MISLSRLKVDKVSNFWFSYEGYNHKKLLSVAKKYGKVMLSQCEGIVISIGVTKEVCYISSCGYKTTVTSYDNYSLPEHYNEVYLMVNTINIECPKINLAYMYWEERFVITKEELNELLGVFKKTRNL